MKRIAIDFAPASWWRGYHRIAVGTRLLLVAGIFACGNAAWHSYQLNKQGHALQTERQQWQAAREKQQRPLQTVTVRIGEDEARAVNAAITQLNLPWHDIFNAIEAATPASIALLKLEPDAARNLIKGTAEAKSSNDMVAYLHLLKQQPALQDALLTRHETNDKDPNLPLRFQFEAILTAEAQ